MIPIDIKSSSNISLYVTCSVIVVIAVLMFITGYMYRAHNEYNRIVEYQPWKK
jgi:hypothetical protein